MNRLVCFALLFTLANCTSSVTKTINIFWEKNAYAQLFKIGTFNGSPVLQIYHPFDSGRVLQKFYKGKNKPGKNWQNLDSIESIAAGSCILARYLELLGEQERVVALDNLDFFSSSYFQSKQSELLEFQKSAGIQYEKLAAQKCDVLLSSGMPKDLNLEILKKIALPVVLFQNHLEKHPLGSAEWIKVVAFLVNRKEAVFEKEKVAYEGIRDKMGDSKINKVLLNAPYHGIWYVPKTETPIGQILKDANAILKPYLPGKGSSPLAVEQIYTHADSIDYWLNPNLHRTRESMLSLDKRLWSFPPFLNAKIYNNTKQLQASGANNYYETFSTQPSLILQDLSLIFAGKNKELAFFEPLD